MRPVRFPQQTGVLNRPATMTDEECEPLPVCMPATHDAAISCWRPTWRERLAILFGKPVWLWVIGGGMSHPPVSLETRNPFNADSN